MHRISTNWWRSHAPGDWAFDVLDWIIHLHFSFTLRVALVLLDRWRKSGTGFSTVWCDWSVIHGICVSLSCHCYLLQTDQGSVVFLNELGLRSWLELNLSVLVDQILIDLQWHNRALLWAGSLNSMLGSRLIDISGGFNNIVRYVRQGLELADILAWFIIARSRTHLALSQVLFASITRYRIAALWYRWTLWLWSRVETKRMLQKSMVPVRARAWGQNAIWLGIWNLVSFWNQPSRFILLAILVVSSISRDKIWWGSSNEGAWAYSHHWLGWVILPVLV